MSTVSSLFPLVAVMVLYPVVSFTLTPRALYKRYPCNKVCVYSRVAVAIDGNGGSRVGLTVERPHRHQIPKRTGDIVLSMMNDSDDTETNKEDTMEMSSIAEQDNMDEATHDDDDDEESMMTSADMAIGIATHIPEEATVSTEIAVSRVVPHDADASDTETVLVDADGEAEKTTPKPSAVETETTIEAPSVKKILKFAIPAIGVWLCGPMLSLIDTSAVGLLSGTAQQAALNPAVAVTEYAALLIAFMYTATTNLVASAQEKDRLSEDKPLTSKNFIAALQLSGFVGAALGTILFGFAVPLLRTIIGNDAIDPEVYNAALKYVRIRALGMPAAAIIGSSQAASLGMQDIKSPLYVLLAAAVVNFIGDVSLVGSSHPVLGGAAGAAWATVGSQYAAVFFFVKWLCHRASLFSVFKKRSNEEAQTSRLDKYSTRGFLQGKFRGRDFFKLPSREKVADFTPYLVPVTSTQLGRVSSYVAMSHVISSSLGTVSMASQQVILSLWNCLYPVGESLSLTAQSFVPSIVERKVSKARSSALSQTLVNFWKAGALFGAGLGCATLCIPLLNQFFTADPAVITLVNSVVPLLLIIFSTLGIFTSSEGVLLGQKDLGFLGKSYTSFFFVIPYLMLRVKRRALSGTAQVNLRSVWTVFTAYQIFRTCLWVLRCRLLEKRWSHDKYLVAVRVIATSK